MHPPRQIKRLAIGNLRRRIAKQSPLPYITDRQPFDLWLGIVWEGALLLRRSPVLVCTLFLAPKVGFNTTFLVFQGANNFEHFSMPFVKIEPLFTKLSAIIFLKICFSRKYGSEELKKLRDFEI